VKDEILKIQLKRVNPFQGLVIDADVWQDAHDYHRSQQRLHLLAFHETGIVEGLEVVGNNPPNQSVVIQPGLAIDPEGNTIIVSQPQNYQIKMGQKGTVYLVIQFREIPMEPFQPPDGGQATRILEAYKIEQRDKLPEEAYLELARIDVDPGKESIKDARNPSRPGDSEINLNYRKEAKAAVPVMPVSEKPAVQEKPEKVVETAKAPAVTQETVTIGYAVLAGSDKKLHLNGLQNLCREAGRRNNVKFNVAQDVSLDTNLGRYMLLYLTGNSGFELTDEQQAALKGYLQSKGTIFGEGCTEEKEEGKSKGAREFGLAFNQLAGQLGCKLETVQHGHSLLSSANVFSAAPPGAEPNGLLLEGGNIIYSGSDYGCAWQGGHKDNLLSRDTIRAAFEIGENIVEYARMAKTA